MTLSRHKDTSSAISRQLGGTTELTLEASQGHTKWSSSNESLQAPSTVERFAANSKTIRSWTLGTGKNKKSCLVFNEKFVVARELLDRARAQLLDCKGKVIDPKIKVHRQQVFLTYIFVLPICITNRSYLKELDFLNLNEQN